MLNRDEEALLKKLKRSEQRLIAAYKLVALGTWDWDLVSNEQAWSDKTYEILGVEPGKAVTRELFESLLHPDDLKYVNDCLAQGLKQEGDITYGYRIIRPNGEERYIYSHLTFEKDENGDKVRVLGTNQDITEQKLIRRKIEKAEEMYRLLTDHSNDLICLQEPNGAFRYISPSVKNLLGYEQSEFLGKKIISE